MKKKTLPHFIQPQLPTIVLTPPVEKNWIHEIKFDGIRLQIHFTEKEILLFDVKGILRTSEFPTLVEAFSEMKLKNTIVEGEAVIIDRQGKSQHSHLMKALRFKDDTQIKFFFFDLLFYKGVDYRSHTLIERKDLLKTLIPDIHPRLRFSDHVRSDPENFFNINCQQQLEGIVSKRENAVYKSGKNMDWCQTKCSKTKEFMIAGFSEDSEEILLGFYERDKLHYAGRVHADKKFMKIKKKLSNLSQETSSFEKIPKMKDVKWVKPDVVVTVNFSNWTDEKKLRNPVLLDLVT